MKKKIKIYYFILGLIIALFISTCVCFGVIATGNVDTRRIIVYSGTAEKAYDGTPLTSTMYGVKDGNLREGHTLIASPYGAQTEVGASLNYFHYMIVDEEGNSVESEYRVICVPGILLVHEPGWIDWKELEKAQSYLDKFGNIDLDASGLDIDKEKLEDLLSQGEAPEIDGETSGEALGKLLGALGMFINEGELPAELNGSGEINSEGESIGEFDNELKKESNGLGDNPEREVLKIYSESDRDYYLRYESFGNYNGSGWDKAVEYTESVVSPLYYSGLTLSNGYKTEQIQIEMLDQTGMYLLPYYSITGVTNEKSDVKISYKSDNYSAMVVSEFDYLLEHDMPKMNSILASQEEIYRQQHVYDNYLSITPTLKEFLINRTKFTSSGVDLIKEIRDYIISSATYNINFASFPDDVDMITYFLDQGKEGICQHFAAAGTMMFRAYGIPARYTCGYKATSCAENWTTITEKYAHAWVEIYVDNLGWVPVEVTGSDYDEVRKGVLCLDTVSKEKTYDGQSFSASEVLAWEIKQGALRPGHKIEAVYEQEPELPINVGEYSNFDFGYRIVDANGDDVTDSYTVQAENNGKLTIKKRELTIIATSDELEYTGEEQKLPTYELFGETAPNDEIVVITSTGATDLGVYANVLEIKIENALKEDVSSQYELEVLPGEIEIIKIKLEVYTESYDHVYNKEYAIHKGYVLYTKEKLLSGHIDKFKEGSYENLIKEVGEEAENVFEIYISDGENDVTDLYYDIEYVEYGTLKVLPIQLALETDSGEKAYDGEDFCVSTKNLTGELLSGDRFVEISYTTVNEIGVYENVLTYDIVENINGIDVSVLHRYQVSETWGTLEIYASELIIETTTDSKVYDGKPLSEETPTLLSGTLLSNHEIRLKGQAVSITEPSTVENTNEFGVFIIGSDVEVTDMYKVKYEYGTLTIEYRRITIKNTGATKTYDGEWLTCAEKDVVSGELALGHDLELVGELAKILEPGTIYNANEYRVISKEIIDGEEVVVDHTRFYIIDYQKGQDTNLTITKINLVVRNLGETKTYDGEWLSNTNKVIEEGELLNGHELQLIGEPTRILYVATVENANEYRVISRKMVDGEEVIVDHSMYYDIAYITDDDTKLIINPIEITIETQSAEKYYDGIPLAAIVPIVTGETLLGHEVKDIRLVSTDQVMVPCENANIYGIFGMVETPDGIIEVDHADKTGGYYIYNVTYEYGTLLIKPIVIKYTTPSDKKVYDGEPLYNTEITVEIESNDGKPAPGHEIAVKNYTSIIEVGKEKNNVQIHIIYADGKQEVENYLRYYSIQITRMGELEVTSSSGDGDDNEQPDDNDEPSTPGGIGGDLSTDSNDLKKDFEKTLFALYSDKGGVVYLREYSFGDYNGKGFEAPNLYQSEFSPLYYIASQLSSSTDKRTLIINTMPGFDVNVLPYYSVAGTANGDVSVTHESGYYSITAIDFDYFENSNVVLTGSLAELEALYREFVMANYSSVGDNDLVALLKDTFTNRDNLSGIDLISFLATQVQTYAEYNLEFEFEEGQDVIRQFLEKREGICQHYAATATMLFRAYGIPARYVGGYMVNTKAGKTTEVKGKNAHAWVEVYIDNLGWIPIEVTGTSSEDEQDTLRKIKLNVSSYGGEWEYDGEEHYNSTKPALLSGSGELLENHEIVLTYYTKIVDVGTKDNVIEVKIVDTANNNEDVSYLYDISYVYAPLKVNPRSIIIKTADREAPYGTTLKGSMDDVSTVLADNEEEIGLIDGHQIRCEFTGEISDYGECDNEIINIVFIKILEDGTEIDVSKNYVYTTEFGTLFIY